MQVLVVTINVFETDHELTKLPMSTAPALFVINYENAEVYFCVSFRLISFFSVHRVKNEQGIFRSIFICMFPHFSVCLCLCIMQMRWMDVSSPTKFSIPGRGGGLEAALRFSEQCHIINSDNLFLTIDMHRQDIANRATDIEIIFKMCYNQFPL